MSLDTAFYESLRQKYGQFVPPVECTEWCEAKDGHPHEYHAEDQNCWRDGPAIRGTPGDVADGEGKSGAEPNGLTPRLNEYLGPSPDSPGGGPRPLTFH